MADDGANIGNAYLTVHPKVADGFEGELERSGGSAGGKFGGAFQVAVGNIMANVATSAATFIADTMKTAFSEYSNYEQLTGGVEKIFDQMDTERIFSDAQNAYKDLNMSANDYMETINQVGAVFSSTMGDEAGYDAARKGMLAISDYASGTGRDINELNEKFRMISRSSSSYQSIADQFAGILPQTSDDFLAQAQAAGLLSDQYQSLTEVPLDEYQQALIGMLEQGVAGLGLTGNTLAESTETISGSLAMLQGAWSNFLVGMFDENADMDELIGGLLDSIGAVLQNAWPRIEEAARSLFMRIPAAFDAVMHEQFPQVAAAFDQIKVAFDTVAPYIQTWIETALPIIQQVISGVMGFITGEVIPMFQQIWAIIQPALETVFSSIMENMPMIGETTSGVFGMIGSIIETVWPYAKQTILIAVAAISTAIQVAWPIIEAIIVGVCTAIQFITEKVWPNIQSIIENVVTGITTAIDTMNSIVSTVQSIFDSVQSAITNPMETAQGIIEDICTTIENIINSLNLQLPEFAMPHFWVYGGEFPWGIGGEGSMPDFGVDWYATGGIVNGAQLIGAGERGAELIWPSYGPYLDRYADAIASRMGDRGGVDIHDCNFYVRKEEDIRRVAVQLNTLINRQTAGVIA